MIRFRVVKSNRGSLLAGGRYYRDYLRNSVIKAEPGTLGVFVFERRIDADRFAKGCRWEKGSDKSWPFTVRVQGIGKGRKLAGEVISQSMAIVDLDEFYRGVALCRTMMPPPGTMVYDAVKVLT